MTIHQLSPPSIATVKAVANFSRLFAADLVRITSTTAAAIDDIPSLFILFEGISYAGPDILISRTRELTQRLSLPDATIAVVTGGTEDKPKAFQIKSGKSTIDFRLASDRSSDRLPSKFSGAFVSELAIDRIDFTAALAGADAISSKLLTFVGDGNSLVLTALCESETYTAALTDVPTTTKFQYNYSVEYLRAIDKLLPKAVKEVTFSITAKGHMQIELPTEMKQIVASVFLLDVKNR